MTTSILNRRTFLWGLTLGASSLASSVAFGEQTAGKSGSVRLEGEAFHMGVKFRIIAYVEDQQVGREAIARAFKKIETLDQILSDYKADSETNLLCLKAGNGEAIAVSTELFEALAISHEFSEVSDGAFDVTVGPLTKLWRRARRMKKLPAKGDLEEARQLVGMQHVTLDREHRTVRLAKPNMQLDFGAIGQGLAADVALSHLRENGIVRAMVDGSGDIAIGEPPPGEKGWKVALSKLNGEAIEEVKILSCCGISTSGDAFQALEIDGKRYSHILNPKTGQALDRPISNTILAKTATQADALASIGCVLGPGEKLEQILQKYQAGSLILQAAATPNTPPEKHQNSRFQQILDKGSFVETN